MKSYEYKNINFIIGTNAKENWQIFDNFKNINQDYIWFHLNSFPSPYVIMNSTKNNLEEYYSKNEIKDILEYGAKLCKEYSKYKFLNDLKILYMPLKKLEKTNKIGEVIITGKKNIITL
tara:strand:- start:14308 stop:14664 length:357 start_codon:yes stop_codon:yes gene_type:complete